MSKCKIALILIIPSLLLIISLSQAVAVTGNLPSPAAAPARTKTLRVTGVVKKMENNVLYLENNKRYDLRNVKVTEAYDLNNRISDKKRMAEMLFINGTLKEVNIR
ncbi:MAG: hypothetical protein WCW53_03060 [Syntrophales bacterium]|jgi:hypothetical protein